VTAPDGPHPRIPPPYGQPAYGAQYVVRADRNGLGTASLVLGILGLIFSVVPVIGIVAWPLVILGLVLGLVGISRAGRGEATNKGVAIAGTVLSSIGLAICVAWFAVLGAFTSGV
jgi:hypothetical protein